MGFKKLKIGIVSAVFNKSGNYHFMHSARLNQGRKCITTLKVFTQYLVHFLKREILI